jgi:hypothetical protein
VRRADDDKAALLEKYGMPPEIPVVPSARVPELVTGEPETLKMELPGTDSPTEVTPVALDVTQDGNPFTTLKNCPLVPIGNLAATPNALP